MKNIAQKTLFGVSLLLASLVTSSTTAFAATVVDEGAFFDNASQFESELAQLEAERGLEVFVETYPESDMEMNITQEADDLLGENENAIAVVLEAGTDKLGVSYGERVTYVVAQDSLEKIIDKEMIPLFQEGEYSAGILQLVDSVNFFLGLEDETERPSAPGINGWFADNKEPFAVAIAAFVLFFAFSMFFLAKRSVKKAEDLSEALSNEKVRRLKEVKAFWDFTDPSVKDRFEQAANITEREAVIAEIFANQSFIDDPVRLTNVVGSFMYPGKIEKNKSIKSFLDQEVRVEKIREESLELWEGLTEEQKESFRGSDSETHQEALAAQFFPDRNPVEMSARFRVMVADSRSTDPNYVTYVEQKLNEAESKRTMGEKKKRKLFGLFGGK